MPAIALSILVSFAQSPLSQNGRLKLVGNQLSNECGSPVQLKGMSTHGVMFHQNCYKESTVETLANDWGADVLRLAIYTEDVGGTAGYINGDRTFWDGWIDLMVGYAKDNGIYVVIDWHILEDGNPNTYKTEAKAFFAKMSDKYKNEKHVLYEICNEPNGGTNWGTIKSYANEVIPVIRANDPEGIILVGTPEWSSDLWSAANDPITGSNAHNLMYSFHFYANSHYDYDRVRQTSAEIPIFVTEWGSVDASGDGGFNPGSSDTWLGVLDGNNNGGVTISSCNWALVDKAEAASALEPGACDSDSWNDRTTAGDYIYNYIHTADNFVQCNSAGDDDGDGVTNGDDLCQGTPTGTYVDANGCPALQGDADNDGIIDANDICANTPENTNVNIHGCEIYQSFVSNVCEGFNNVQGYAYTTFTEDTLANVDIWNRPENENPVYSATVANGTLNIDVTDGDPDFETMGFSFGEVYRFNGVDYDTTLIPIDLTGGNITVNMEVRFEGSSYSLNKVMFDIQLEDENGNALTSNATGVLFRSEFTLNTWHDIEFDFTDGKRESWDEEICNSYGVTKPDGAPCYIEDFDYTHVSKVLMWVNPGAGEDWAFTEAFNGTWKVDNFSIGYEGSPQSCDATRDDDEDGVRIEDDKCPNTGAGASVDANGCAATQLDHDMDGVSDFDDECPNTPENEDVDYKGCAGFEADDDDDGVTNDLDNCPNTVENAVVDINGCAVTVGVSDKHAGLLKVYPIPASDKLTIEQATFTFNAIEISDVTGKIVFSGTLNSVIEVISTNELETGTYLVTLTGTSIENFTVLIK